jgi:molybdopterin molybdotransferase
MALLPVADALARILDGVAPTEAETVPLLEAHGRVLAEDLTAKLTQPPFTASAMDGYAVRAAEVATAPARLNVVGVSAAGSGHHAPLRPGEAVRIFTGAPLPDGADTVVIQENTEADGKSIVVREAPCAGANVRQRGIDFTEGAKLLTAGRRLDARALTLAAAMGYGEARVRRRPLVAMLATGDELVAPGTLPGPDQIVSANPIGLAALVAGAGGTPRLLGIAPDRREAIAAKIAEAEGADVLVTIGGASVGDHDLVAPALKARALIAALLGEREPKDHYQTALLTHPLEANGPRLHLLRATLGRSDAGALTVTALPSQDSSLLAPLADADCLIVRASAAPAAAAGSPVEIQRLDF